MAPPPPHLTRCSWCRVTQSQTDTKRNTSTLAKKFKFSPFGIAIHPWLNKPDTKFDAEGVYKVDLRMSGAPAQKFMEGVKAASDAALEEYLQKQQDAGKMTKGEAKKWTAYYPFEVEEDAEGNPTGDIIFSFKQNAKIKLKDGTVKDISMVIRDAKDKEMHKPVFGGSELRTMYSMRPIPMTSLKQAGVRLDFAAVQVKSLKTSGNGPTFGEVDGYAEDAEDQEHAANENNEGSANGADY